jgi:hypothetical protein
MSRCLKENRGHDAQASAATGGRPVSADTLSGIQLLLTPNQAGTSLKLQGRPGGVAVNTVETVQTCRSIIYVTDGVLQL